MAIEDIIIAKERGGVLTGNPVSLRKKHLWHSERMDFDKLAKKISAALLHSYSKTKIFDTVIMDVITSDHKVKRYFLTYSDVLSKKSFNEKQSIIL